MKASLTSSTFSPTTSRFRVRWVVSPLLAMLYPFPLKAFHKLIGTIADTHGQSTALLWAAATVSLVLAFAVPVTALVSAIQLGSVQHPTRAELYARRTAFLAVATPPLFTFTGVVLYMLGKPTLDVWLLGAVWLLLAAVIVSSDRSRPGELPPVRYSARARVAHGIAAAAILVLFLIGHIANHFVGLVGADAHVEVMKALRHVYRASLVEPVLLAAFAFQIVSGSFMSWRFTARATDPFRSFQIASGVYLMFFIISHVNAVLVLARGVEHIDPGWGFAIGAPTGLIHDAWNIRLLPLYSIAVFFLLSHLGSGARVVMLAHGRRTAKADLVMIVGAVLAAGAATIITLAMCGLRVHFE
ncbi:hypothetical protein [Caballeronia sp. 15711]|uniref:hypothetical protein n=1 Tax=Caballeronia sp. 15711 TaxID=3391029 RepID=UPI0039E5CBE3